MKVSILQENLNKALGVVGRTTTTRSQLPILANILLSAEKGKLKLAATNLETGVNYYIGGKIEKQGSITVPAKIFLEMAASLPAGKVDLVVEGDSLKIKAVNFQAKINGISAAEFPQIPRFGGKPDLSFKIENFKTMVNQVAFAAAADEARPVLAGVRFTSESGKLVLAATDGYRLSLKKFKSLTPQKIKKPLILPARTLQEVARIKEDGEVRAILTKKDNQLIFSLGDVEIVCRLIEGEFPAFEKVIPQECKTKVWLEKEELVQAVKLASIFARETANIVKFKIKKSKLQISANAPQVGSNISEVDVKVEGEENEIAFNFRYLLDFLNSIEKKEIIFEMSSPLNPGAFKIKGDNSLLHIIMPVRVQE